MGGKTRRKGAHRKGTFNAVLVNNENNASSSSGRRLGMLNSSNGKKGNSAMLKNGAYNASC